MENRGHPKVSPNPRKALVLLNGVGEIRTHKSFRTPVLKTIFGASATASTRIDGIDLQEPALLRQEEFAFKDLSAGAQEQFGAAFRLATAEVFAEPFEGTLPVFLDDTFANSDDRRIERMSRALFWAAGRGLQVVLFTCRPDVWNELGATTVRIG